jgi:HSP20 family protein
MSMSTVRELTPKTPGKGSRSVARMSKPLLGMEDLIESIFSRPWMEPMGWRRPLLAELESFEMKFPRIDMVDRDSELLVRAELPGVEKKDLEITIADDFLTIAVRREVSEKEESEHFYRAEMARGAMERTIPLPMDVVGDKAKAELKDGVLELVIPKATKVSRHKVNVR